ncbi:hypothetical protein F4778DRAFT_717352 [Xylariomycetidae sp. FL2044]|nr:hypothetical protein F4778DRAFT_717352 [Xylariomycetidae sp. FL2044]
MGHDIEKGNFGYHYVSGFGSLADFIASDEDHSAAIYSRFDRLSARDLLYYQSDLAELQTLQDQYDIEDAQDVENLKKPEFGPHIRKHTRDWVKWKYSAGVSQGPASAHIQNERWKKRMDLAMEIRVTLKDYQEALIRNSTVLSLRQPSQQTMTAMSNYFHTKVTSHEPKPQETTYSMLTGASSDLYRTDMTDAQIRSSDLVSLSQHSAADPLTYFLKRFCSRLFRTRHQPLLPRHRPVISHLPPHQVTRYSSGRLQLAASFITTFFAAVLLFLPIFILQRLSPSQPNTTLGLIAMFVALFAVAIVVMTNARRAEVFGACAAYAAVLVVFVSGDFAGSAGSGG